VFATGQMMGSHIALRTKDGQPTVGILVPIFSGKKVLYALSVGFPPDNLNRLLQKNVLPTDGIAAIIDSTGTLAARSSQAESYFGPQVAPELLEQLKKKSANTFAFTTKTGIQILSTYRRSSSSGWSVVVAIPKYSIQSPLTRNLAALLLVGILLLGVCLGSAWVVGQRIAKSVRQLHDAAVALGSDELPDVQAAATSETHELSLALQGSARLLTRRTQQLQIANENLQERSAELIEAQHIAKTGNWKWHASTNSIFASEELLRLYGQKIVRSFDAQKGQIFPDEAWQNLKTAAKATLQTKKGFTLLLPTLTKDGAQLWARINGEIVINAEGEVTGLRGTLQDVDHDVKAELAVKENAKRYRTLFDGSPEAIVVHSNGIVAVANTAAAKLFAAHAEPSLVGMSMSQLVHPDFHRDLAARQLAITQLGELVTPVEIKLINMNGLTFSAQVRCTELIFEGERFVQTYIHDLTEERRRDTELAQLQHEMHDLLVWQVAQHTVAALAHEVNQPLASASILCEAANRMLLTDGLAVDANADKPKRLVQTLQHITSDIERAGDVLKNLLRSVNKPDITRLPAIVNELVAESVQTSIDEGIFDCRIITDFAVALPAVKVNRVQIVKVLLNLIHNAAQAMNNAQISNGRIWISTALAADGREICVKVRDEGPGISAALQQEIFQPFITTKSHGLGMGLTISRALIEANGGKLWHTQEDGLGATFHFTLPISS
jgi:PAS domain S-box-containing protein